MCEYTSGLVNEEYLMKMKILGYFSLQFSEKCMLRVVIRRASLGHFLVPQHVFNGGVRKIIPDSSIICPLVHCLLSYVSSI